jgi:hypothetical protein
MKKTRDEINMDLKHILLETVFPSKCEKYNKQFAKYGATMVVIGGVSVEMCADMDEDARHFLHNVFSEDVDIKIVATKDINKKKIHKLRMNFLTEIKLSLETFIKDYTSERIQVRIDDSLMYHKIDKVRSAMVVSVAVDYYDKNNEYVSYPLLDTSLFSKTSTAHYDVYKKILHTKVIVPFYTKDNVNYASCEYMMFDTCRMLIEKANYLREKRSMFALMKFTKYVIKFMSLYVLVGKNNKQMPKELMNIYHRAYKVLQKINTFKIKHGFKEMHNIKYNEAYIKNTTHVLSTILKSKNINDLVKAANQASKNH